MGDQGTSTSPGLRLPPRSPKPLQGREPQSPDWTRTQITEEPGTRSMEPKKRERELCRGRHGNSQAGADFHFPFLPRPSRGLCPAWPGRHRRPAASQEIQLCLCLRLPSLRGSHGNQRDDGELMCPAGAGGLGLAFFNPCGPCTPVPSGMDPECRGSLVFRALKSLFPRPGLLCKVGFSGLSSLLQGWIVPRRDRG